MRKNTTLYNQTSPPIVAFTHGTAENIDFTAAPRFVGYALESGKFQQHIACTFGEPQDTSTKFLHMMAREICPPEKKPLYALKRYNAQKMARK